MRNPMFVCDQCLAEIVDGHWGESADAETRQIGLRPCERCRKEVNTNVIRLNIAFVDIISEPHGN